MPACDLDRSVAFCFYNKREKPNTIVSVFSGEVQTIRRRWPVGAPVNASFRTSRCTTHDSWIVWFAIPFLFGTFTFYSLSVSALAFYLTTSPHILCSIADLGTICCICRSNFLDLCESNAL